MWSREVGMMGADILKSVRKSIREDLCKGCIYWKSIDGSTKDDCVCLYCYLEGRSRRRADGKCLEYKGGVRRARKQVP